VVVVMVARTINAPSDGRHLEFIDGRNKRTTVREQQANDLESVEVFVANAGAFTVVVGQLQLCFHQQTVQHPTHSNNTSLSDSHSSSVKYSNRGFA